MKTEVLLREEKNLVEVNISDKNKPKIEDYIKERWQKIMTLLADVLDVPAALIMRISQDHMEIFLKSENEDNPYPSDGKDTLSHGLYCETVIGRDQALHIENALKHKLWKDNPDVNLNMIAYYGLPLKWGDGTVFGTICALDNKSNPFEKKYRDLLDTFREMLEQDLMFLEEKQILEQQSDRDFLTNIYNRRAFNEVVKKYYQRFLESKEKFSLIMMDIDRFKYINDKYGHVTGDRILKRFAEVANKSVSESSLLARFGGDEFILVSNETNQTDIKEMMDHIKKKLTQDDFLSDYHIEISYGVSIVNEEVEGIDHLIEQADISLYKQKNQKKASQ